MKCMQGSSLGQRLRYFRETRQESVAEVSGAVEIDPDVLERIERDEERPTEDILTLLINHFDLREQEAVQLWESAGFVRGEARDALQDIASRATVVLLAIDARVMYVNGATISADQNGVILGFSQTGPQGQQLPVTRVGMSYEQAQQVMDALNRALLRKRYLPKDRLLPPGDQSV